MLLLIPVTNHTSDPIKNVSAAVDSDSRIDHLSSTFEQFLKNTTFSKNVPFLKILQKRDRHSTFLTRKPLQNTSLFATFTFPAETDVSVVKEVQFQKSDILQR